MEKSNHRYYSFNDFLREYFGEKVYKISLNGGFTCPNRDGTLGFRGCIFCSEGGSGEFASSPNLSIKNQITNGIEQIKHKSKTSKYIAYFQAFTNTYGPIEKLRNIFMEAIDDERIVALAIGTRPDCLPDEVLSLLNELNCIKPVFVELGLQTIHKSTADFIRRGYPLSVFDDAVMKLDKIHVFTVVHLILGLPKETKEMILDSVHHLNSLPIHGIKFSMLHILKHTDLCELYTKKPFPLYDLDSYVDLIVTCIGNLREDLVIHRLTGDGPRDLLITPRWTLHKRYILNQITHQLKVKQITQGCILKEENRPNLI